MRKSWPPKGIHYVDVGTSGGVWGLERGYCMMIGGEAAVVERLDPIFATLAPGIGDIPRTPGRESAGGTSERGYLHCGPNGAGHFVKMVHNGIEYGIMAAYAEGLGILRSANIGKQTHEIDAETTPLRDPEHYQYDLNLPDIAELWRRGSVIASWLLDLTANGAARRSRSREVRRPRIRLGRGPLDHPCRRRRGRAGAGAHLRALLAVQLARRGRLPEQAALGDALPVRRARGKIARQVTRRLIFVLDDRGCSRMEIRLPPARRSSLPPKHAPRWDNRTLCADTEHAARGVLSATPVIVIAAVAAIVVAHQADAWIHEQRKQLSALDQLGIGAELVRLDVEQEPAVAQDFGGVDDAG